MPGSPTPRQTDHSLDRYRQSLWIDDRDRDAATPADAATTDRSPRSTRVAPVRRAEPSVRPAPLGTTPARRDDALQALALELTLAEQRERQRLARLLHDHLQQLLYAAKLSLAALQRRAEETTFREELSHIDELVDECIEESRSLTVELSPPILAHAGLSAALEWLARRTTEKYRLRVTVAIDPRAEPADDETRLLLFDAARELLFNVVKHARADAAHVALQLAHEQDIELSVADNGVGFDAAAERPAGAPRGFGLFSIAQRLQGWDGSLKSDSTPGQGARVTIRLPRRGTVPSQGPRA